MDYELYHDESKENGYWHGILLVPTTKKQLLIDYLEQIRKNTRYFEPLGIKKVKNKGKIYNSVDAWIQIGIAALITHQKGLPFPWFTGKLLQGKKQYEQFKELIGLKFIIFQEVDNHLKMNNHVDYGSKVETTFWMGLKGGIHLLGNNKNTIHITKMHFDGHEHYGRHINQTRIINRLSSLRDYCSISNNKNLIDDRSSNHKLTNSQTYQDCQLLQLTDVMIGSFRTILGGATRTIHQSLAKPVKELITRYQRGPARMRNSRWRDSFCISQCYLTTNGWVFDTIEVSSQ